MGEDGKDPACGSRALTHTVLTGRSLWDVFPLCPRLMKDMTWQGHRVRKWGRPDTKLCEHRMIHVCLLFFFLIEPLDVDIHLTYLNKLKSGHGTLTG